MNFFTITGLFFAAVGIIIAAMKWMFSNAAKKGANNQKLHDAHERIKAYDSKTVECEKRFARLEEHKADNKDTGNIRLDISLIKSDISFMKDILNAALSGHGCATGIPTQSKSPVSLSPLGEELSKRMNLETRISNNWDNIHAYLDINLKSENAYDIQQFCIETATAYPERLLSADDVEFLKNFAYQEGKPLAFYGGMIGVIIRDAYFRHKNIDVLDIDKQDSQKQSG